MASLHAWRGGSLPEKREELYSDAVNLLLDWWESPKVVRDSAGKAIVLHPSLGEWLKIDRDKVRDFINQLAYEAHLSQPELRGTADVLEDSLVSGLMRLSKNPDVNPVRLIEYLSQRAGLLIPKGVGVYTFPHRTFQEYLAACHLTDHGFPDLIAKLAVDDPDRWREVILLAAAKAARGSTYAFWALVDTLTNPEINENHVSNCWGAHLAGQITIETADFNHLSERDSLKFEQVRKWQLALIASEVFPASEKVLAGKNLFIMGDSRFNSQVWCLPNDPMLGFVEILDGSFLFGKEGVEVMLDTFFMARYPTTIDQFNVFVQNSGYESEKVRGVVKGVGNEPVTGIALGDAVAYCNWLNDQLNTEKILPAQMMNFWEQGGRIALPDELEWEKAAKGGLELFHKDGQGYSNPLPNRIFPWGDEHDENNANTSNIRIRATSPVGCFSVGSSPYGIQDLSGNVWEWTRSKFDQEEVDEKLKEHYVMRGGTYGGDISMATCSNKVRGNPLHATKGRGFRTVLTKRF